MTRTPDEIKKGLEYISIKDVARKLDAWEDGIPYDYVEDAAADALALIQQLQDDNAEKDQKIRQLEAQNVALSENIMWMEAERDDLKRTIQQLQAERDAAVADLSQCTASHCPYCKHWDRPESAIVCINCRNGAPRCKQHFEWCGVQKEE